VQGANTASGEPGMASSVLTASVSAKVDGRWLRAQGYPKHTTVESVVNDVLESAHEWTIKHSGLAGAPELLCIVHSHGDRPYGDVEVRVLNTSEGAIHVESIRAMEARVSHAYMKAGT
jgi:hypothetical protein